EGSFTRRCAEITAAYPNFKEHHSAERAEQLFNTAGMLAGRERNFEGAHTTLDELEALLKSQVPSASQAPAAGESDADPGESQKLDSIAKGKRRVNDLEAEKKEWAVLSEAMRNLESRFQKVLAHVGPASPRGAQLEQEHARLLSVDQKRSDKTDSTS